MEISSVSEAIKSNELTKSATLSDYDMENLHPTDKISTALLTSLFALKRATVDCDSVKPMDVRTEISPEFEESVDISK